MFFYYASITDTYFKPGERSSTPLTIWWGYQSNSRKTIITYDLFFGSQSSFADTTQGWDDEVYKFPEEIHKI